MELQRFAEEVAICRHFRETDVSTRGDVCGERLGTEGRVYRNISARSSEGRTLMEGLKLDIKECGSSVLSVLRVIDLWVKNGTGARYGMESASWIIAAAGELVSMFSAVCVVIYHSLCFACANTLI